MKGSTMGWFTEGSEHEGYVVCVFADGMYGSGGRYMEINLMTPDGRPVAHENGPGSDAWRPPSQVVGWRVACSCVPFREHVILDPLWTRVWDPADEDVAAGRIYAGPPASADAADMGDREDLEPLFLDVWHRHVAPDLSLHAIGTLSRSLKDLEAQLDDAVSAARAAGVSWDKIGRAFGISRQGAQKRWETASAVAASRSENN
ncbi:hypothetical protein LFT44_20750 (plasmid) [Arthrobacter sp. FW306-05-C]|uniref:hypothetical protein n=1 Tax=Arthrobacter sp. FW306-05-C TaxID=2879620 RepID=UPI001F33DE4E|nr:hypothetical protein [Arthrobacter sp. FW306-05-C]UKA68966.1 hypothetical protein LFT44_20750 [Arthrobacter sp. FW306-05-C]